MITPLDRFFAQFHARNPVSASCIGVHEHDAALPDWSAEHLEAMHAGMFGLHAELGAEPWADEWSAIDADLARGHLEIRTAEDNSSHGVRGNPALWTGEAIFGALSLMLRPSSSMRRRAMAVAARLAMVPSFFEKARAILGERPMPQSWMERALRECDGAAILLTTGMNHWLRWLPRTTGKVVDGLPTVDEVSLRVSAAAVEAHAAFAGFAGWLRAQRPAADAAVACGPELFDLILARGHHSPRSRADLLAEARALLPEATAKLDADARAVAGSWDAARERLAHAHPAPGEYLASFERTWTLCYQRAERQDLVTWPRSAAWPLRYVVQPEWVRDCAPYFDFRPYRSPAAADTVRSHDYLVPPVPVGEDAERHLAEWNHAVIKLTHVVHHGGIGRHVQNWHAYNQTQSKVGRIAAVDCASRIALHCGATMSQGWACYAAEVMEETGFLTPFEKLLQQHSRIGILARAIVDVSLHDGSMAFADAAAFCMNEGGMTAPAARAEAIRSSMFPGTGIASWLGAQGILDLREELKRRQDASFSLKRFHDDLLAHGSIPVPLVARRMLEHTA